MKAPQQSIMIVKYSNGGHRWFQVSRGRHIGSLMDHFRNIPTFKYAKIHFYFKKKRMVGDVYYWFNRTSYGEN